MVHQSGMNNDGTGGATPIGVLNDQKIIKSWQKSEHCQISKKTIIFL